MAQLDGRWGKTLTVVDNSGPSQLCMPPGPHSFFRSRRMEYRPQPQHLDMYRVGSCRLPISGRCSTRWFEHTALSTPCENNQPVKFVKNT